MATLSVIGRRNILCTILGRKRTFSNRLISTSEKKKEATEACPPAKIPDFSKPLENKNWVSFGFSDKSYVEDRYRLHYTFFLLITLTICGTGFIFMYYPDRKHLHWSRREAYLRLHEREQLGLDPIDPNYIDPAKMILPPDEEIGENDIII